MNANGSGSVDVAIVGGGLVGASLAVALAPLGLTVALIEAVPYDDTAQPSFDERTTALSNGSRRILETLGVWPKVSALATAIRKIHVSEQGCFGFARIDAAEQGLAALGYVSPNRALGRALWSQLQPAQWPSHPPASSQSQLRRGALKVYCPADVMRVTPGAEATLVEFRAAGVAESIRARLIVAADGVHSAVRASFGVAADVRDYEQTAVITTVLPQRFHDHVAYERFTDSGPLALLPLEHGRCTLVLTLSPQAAQAALRWSDQEFLAEVQRRFGFRLGHFLQAGRRVPYPLSLSRAQRTSSGRCIIIGNAAQGLHPVAGMGFNLGLRDAATLAEVIAGHACGADFDAGSDEICNEYDAWRSADRRRVIAFTDGVVRSFANPLKSVRLLRNLGLLAFDSLPPAKAALAALSTGGTGRVPKLARGVALSVGPP
jgi:2-octaprenyl-6-methoxyphenol hydroxylase